MMSRNLALYGMMGVGKSTVGRALARRLGRRFADTDEELRRWSGRSIPELFAEHGEDGFRDLERQVIEELATFHDLVLSLGGGAVLRDDNVANLLLTGVLVELHAPVEVLTERLRHTAADRPLLAGGDVATRLRETAEAREERYLAVGDVRIDASGAVDDVVEEVLHWALQAGDVLTPSEHEQVMT
ncbi:shikimate kinase [Nitriliruptoraceae bacterium ZYF776]|nr:shikimate kinase [Profundirhabdus halotolerans]